MCNNIKLNRKQRRAIKFQKRNRYMQDRVIEEFMMQKEIKDLNRNKGE